jgi:23S rRNA pseudouridine1911/1915/1917 synthase
MIPTCIYQDKDVIVLNKPPGMVVNRAESVKGETVQDFIEKRFLDFHFRFTDTDTEFIGRAGIVHRIDKETSGILLVAKNPEAFYELQRQFKERLIKKTYVALVHGVVPEHGEIRAPVGRLPWNKEHFGIVPGGKDSVTKFIRKGLIEKEIGGKRETISYVEVYPETGRTHQIRVHFKYLGHPLLGDYLYAGRKQSRDDRNESMRVMLHAKGIVFTHPASKESLAFEAPIPDDMMSIIAV